ncbi:MAG: radical SAM protein [Candidatus Latescibacteria bacterium]|jgi:radical SAM protein with 4Fe4S-binding SPASM domain|nr:radical SAM protein [Candidatus Latescibacterota bacterium]
MDFRTHTVSWNLTQRCNLQCSHCYLDAAFRVGRKVDELSTQDCYNIIGQIAEVNPNALLILTGGEPLLRSDIFSIVRRAAERGFFVVVATNGTTINPTNVRQMVDAGVKGVGLSLHSSREEMHDRFTDVPGSWQAAVDAAVVLREAGMEFVIQTSVMAWNYEEIPQIVDFAYQLGAKFYNLYLLVCTGRGQGLTDVSSVQYERLLAGLYEIQKKHVGRMLISAKCAPQYKRVIYEDNPDSPFLKSHAGGCPAATHYCQIDPRGEVTPCPYMPIGVGNLRETPFAAIWREAPLLKELRDRSLLEGRCGVCEFRSLCSGCRARAYAKTKNYLAEDPSCRYEPGRHGFEEIVLAEEETLGSEADLVLEWDEAAQNRLQAIPSFARGMVVKGVELFARANRHPVVTLGVMQQAREAVGARSGSAVPPMQDSDGAQDAEAEVTTSLLWSPEARERLSQIPFIPVRDRILKRVEAYAEGNGVTRVTLDVYEAGRGGGDQVGWPS